MAAGAGDNAGRDFLPRSLAFTPGGGFRPDPELAADVVWLDALTENVDRTPRNPNLLVWHQRLWLIDHGAALYRHHAGVSPGAARRRFEPIRNHVLLPYATSILDADARHANRRPHAAGGHPVGDPPSWLTDTSRECYVEDLLERLSPPRDFVREAEDARHV